MLNPPPDSERCTFETAIGRRCRSLRMSADCALCAAHFRAEEKQRLRAEARSHSLVRRSADAAECLAPTASFANVWPPAAEQFIAYARHAMPGSVVSINQLIERVLHLLVGNQMSARSATAAAQLFRLLLKAQPQVDAETAVFNEMLMQQRHQAAARAAQSAADPNPQPHAAAAPLTTRESIATVQPDTTDADELHAIAAAADDNDDEPHTLTDDDLAQLFEPNIAQHLIQVRRAQAARHARAARATLEPHSASAAD